MPPGARSIRSWRGAHNGVRVTQGTVRRHWAPPVVVATSTRVRSFFAPLFVVEAVPVREVLRVAFGPWPSCVIYDARGPLEASVVAAFDAAASEHTCKPLTHVGPVHRYHVTGLER